MSATQRAMTGDELAMIERYCATTDLPPYIGDEVIPALIAEIRRLREALTPLAEHLPIQYHDGDYPHCAYCEGYIGYPDWTPRPAHAADCAWVAARVALGMSRADSW